MTKTTYTNRVNAAGKKLAEMHKNGQRVTSTKAWNTVYAEVFDFANCAKVDGIRKYMPDTLAAVKRAALQYL